MASEIVKSQANAGARTEIYHFRDQQGLEVDFLAPRDGQLWMIECKAGKTVVPAMAARLLALRRAAGRAAGRALVVHRPSRGGPATHALAPGAEAMDVGAFVKAFAGRRQRV